MTESEWIYLRNKTRIEDAIAILSRALDYGPNTAIQAATKLLHGELDTMEQEKPDVTEDES